MSSSEIVRLNVGGTKYITAKSTLRKYPQSMLGAMFMENIPLSTDEDGYYFIDRCGHIFEYILQFWRCGKLVLPKCFNELELLQAEADFYQIEDLISAVELCKREAEAKQQDEVHVLLFCILHYINRQGILSRHQCKDVRLFKKSKDTGFQFVAYNLQEFDTTYKANEKRFKIYLQNDHWVLKEHKILENYKARGFFFMRGIKLDNIMNMAISYTVDVETWIRKPSADF